MHLGGTHISGQQQIAPRTIQVILKHSLSVSTGTLGMHYLQRPIMYL